MGALTGNKKVEKSDNNLRHKIALPESAFFDEIDKF